MPPVDLVLVDRPCHFPRIPSAKSRDSTGIEKLSHRPQQDVGREGLLEDLRLLSQWRGGKRAFLRMTGHEDHLEARTDHLQLRGQLDARELQSTKRSPSMIRIASGEHSKSFL
jgi:hypothetical protein